MPYSKFTLSKAVDDFQLTIVEGDRFLKLEGQTVTIDLNDYPLPPVEEILGKLVWMVQNG